MSASLTLSQNLSTPNINSLEGRSIDDMKSLKRAVGEIKEKNKKMIAEAVFQQNTLYPLLAFKAVFHSLPSNIIETASAQWPNNYRITWRKEFQSKFSKELKILIPGVLSKVPMDDEVAHILFCVGFHQLKAFFNQAPKNSWALMAKKERVDACTWIRDNLVQFPDIDAQCLTSTLENVLFLLNQHEEFKACQNLIYFVKFLYQRPPPKNLPFKVLPSDRLYTFLYIYLQGINTHDLNKLILAFMKECKDGNSCVNIALSRCEAEPKNADIKFLRKQFPDFFSVLTHLQSVSEALKIEDFFQELCVLANAYSSSETECSIFLQYSPDLAFIFNLAFITGPIFQNTKELLVSVRKENALISFQEMQRIIADKFNLKDKPALCEMLVKTWWFTRHLDGVRSPLIERLTSYWVRKIVIDEDNWTISKSEFRQKIGSRFLELYPFLPLNVAYASNLYHALLIAKQNQNMRV